MFTLLCIILVIFWATPHCDAQGFDTTLSPSWATSEQETPLRVRLFVDPENKLKYEVYSGPHKIVAPSALGLILDHYGQEVHLGDNVQVEVLSPPREASQTYSTMGGHATANSQYVEASYSVRHVPTGLTYSVDFRVSAAGSPGVAFLYAFRDDATVDKIRIKDDGSEFVMEFGDTDNAWIVERRDGLFSYIGQYMSVPAASLWSRSSQGGTIDRYNTPVTIEDSSRSSPFPYIVINEASLFGFEGFHLVALPGGVGFKSELARGLEYARQEQNLWGPLELELPVKTSWRVIQLAANLDQLANHNLVSDLNPSPDERNPGLFTETSYIKPGRSVWTCLASPTCGHPLLYEQEWDQVTGAAALALEYSTVDIGWEDWPGPWESVKKLTAYGDSKGVGIFLWKHREQVDDPADNYKALRDFLDLVKDAGAVGVKFDFFDAASFNTILLQETILREAAKRKLLLNFHGIQKATGESRTYPNLITQEAIWGLEINHNPAILDKIPPSHNAALTFTRFPTGAADYTPLSLGHIRQGTTQVHQVALLVTFNSPIQTFAEAPRVILEQKFTDIITDIPTTWDVTRVLPPSKIGDMTVLARKKGDDWWLGVVSGTVDTRVVSSIPLDFLDPSKTYLASRLYTLHLSSDGKDEQVGVERDRRMGPSERTLTDILLWGEGHKGDGLVVSFRLEQ
ncbi:unnamed protein product [Vitrella brassicaformis CCMP3155]|uniref:Glycoside hydrolase family 97 protein n=1 Tax=Vitrella brassicaformis (strain CCMP3155) TaxID=1169540 RepID=A0A0G4EEF8_VITBC|nr:unnamed protein product [Vitrella brassicaformis CCMP3155]|eukprot:CEL94071.1 unnamed protein product [Vitrella brassicaformis CCMP3155]